MCANDEADLARTTASRRRNAAFLILGFSAVYTVSDSVHSSFHSFFPPIPKLGVQESQRSAFSSPDIVMWSYLQWYDSSLKSDLFFDPLVNWKKFMCVCLVGAQAGALCGAGAGRGV